MGSAARLHFPLSLASLILLSACPAPVKKEASEGEAAQAGQELHRVFRMARDQVFALGAEGAGVQGTAFAVRHEGKRHLVASFHVVGKLDRPWVDDRKGRRHKGLKVVAVDRLHDLALLDAAGLPGEVAGLELSAGFATSQEVFLVGYPGMGTRGVRLNFSRGVISDAAYRAPTFIGEGSILYLQVTAAINLGHSGSPLLNRHGKVVGVAAWRIDPGAQIQGGNYGVPASHVRELFKALPVPIPAPPPPESKCLGDGDCTWLDYCIEGRCQRTRPMGEACSVDDECNLPHRCHNNACAPPSPANGPCCCDQLCRQPDYCVMGRCRPQSRRGGECAVDQDCVAPLFCVGGRCVREKSAKGGPCHHYLHCKSPLGCVEGRCVSTAGQACKADPNRCLPLACILGRCKARAVEADPCAVTADCRAPLVCAQGSCQAVTVRPPRGKQAR